MEESSKKVKEKILIADYSGKIFESLEPIVSKKYNAIYKTNKQEILSLIKDHSEKISEAMIEIETAKDLLPKIRELPEGESLPVLITTDCEDEKTEDFLLDYEVLDFLKSPFNERRILNRLKTALKLSEANRLISELERDELTGLLTRQAFLRKMNLMRAQSPDKKFCIIAFDFNNFKLSNSMYGESKCNEFLAYTGKELNERFTKGIAGRFGGDQYVLFFEYEHEINIERLSKIRDSILLSAPIPHQVAKAGIYAPIDSELTSVICCDRAFLATREIRDQYGKDIAFFETSVQNLLLNEQRLTETMERALNEEEFQIFYQPKHEAITEKICGAEALVRWNHPEYGFMSPNQFIPLFERNGFITKLDNFVLERVCKDILHWQAEGIPIVPISINISRLDFFEPDYIENQFKLIDRYKIDHSLLHMEVTESLYTANLEVIINILNKARSLGFMIEMDDFGAGYSSLGLLSRFPLNILKLDISFIRNIKDNEIIIESIIKMAHRMKLLTVAEGVETLEQFGILKSLGCDYIQGFYFSQALPIKQFESYLKKTTVMSCGKIEIQQKKDKEVQSLTESMLMAANVIAEGIPGGFLTYHFDENLEIISFNRELLNMLGYETAEEFRQKTGNSFRGIVYEKDLDAILLSIENQISDQNEFYFVEYRIIDKKGKLKYVSALGRLVNTKKHGSLFYVFLNDITEEQRQKARLENEALQIINKKRSLEYSDNANKAKNIFMYNIARDILPSMQTIIRYTRKIEENAENKKIVCENAQRAFQAEENLLAFVNNILEIARLDSGEIKLHEIATDVSNALEQTAALVEEAAKRKKIKLESWSEIQYPYIYQDLRHTVDVVLNILQNAVKYTPVGGTIRFGLKQTPCKNGKECTMEFICEDNGIGMSKEFIPHACKTFTREANEINAKIASSGLGLNLVNRLMELMGGTIEITSQKGKGTKVCTKQPHRYANPEDVIKKAVLSSAQKF
ncbi:MAG: EAL domain-containing protein [Treponema sp.]|nr:EAL domain-containing protein [Treponema sp.]